MKNQYNKFKVILLCTTFIISNLHLFAQDKTPDSTAQKFFMPAIQMGYINHNATNITEGLMIQTSLEYRTKQKFLFRINYDDFSGRLNLKNSNNQTYNARIPISELIAGIGYRFTSKRSNYFLIVQSGLRFYENPVIEVVNGNLFIDQKDATINTIRYTAGYEYELYENIFLNLEIFAGHFYAKKDYWSNAKPHFGITMGVSSRLF